MGAPEWILVGMVKRIHGTTGEMLIKRLTDREERFAAGAELFIPGATLGEAPAGSYYVFEIEGCEVFEGERLVGTVTRLAESAKANPYIEVEPSGGEGGPILIPFIRQAILSVDVEGRRIDIAEGFAV